MRKFTAGALAIALLSLDSSTIRASASSPGSSVMIAQSGDVLPIVPQTDPTYGNACNCPSFSVSPSLAESWEVYLAIEAFAFYFEIAYPLKEALKKTIIAVGDYLGKVSRAVEAYASKCQLTTLVGDLELAIKQAKKFNTLLDKLEEKLPACDLAQLKQQASYVLWRSKLRTAIKIATENAASAPANIDKIPNTVCTAPTKVIKAASMAVGPIETGFSVLSSFYKMPIPEVRRAYAMIKCDCPVKFWYKSELYIKTFTFDANIDQIYDAAKDTQGELRAQACYAALGSLIEKDYPNYTGLQGTKYFNLCKGIAI